MIANQAEVAQNAKARLNGRTPAVTGPPPKAHNFYFRVIGGLS
jgi:hypothetical protein